MMAGYSNQKNGENVARAIGRELKISPKHSVEICRKIQGMMYEDAKEYLQDVIDMKRAVPFRRYNMGVAHKTGTGPGRYPVKACKAILKVLESAGANAESPAKKLMPDNMKIITAAAHKGRTYPGYMPRAHGRSSPWDQHTVNIEIVMEELED
jgi:large subunit ribosomal protein L22